MNLVIGSLGIVITLAASVTGSLTIITGVKKSRDRLRSMGAKYAWVAFAGMAVSTFAMQRALITRDFSVKYVAEQGSSLTPPLYNVATMWSWIPRPWIVAKGDNDELDFRSLLHANRPRGVFQSCEWLFSYVVSFLRNSIRAIHVPNKIVRKINTIAWC